MSLKPKGQPESRDWDGLLRNRGTARQICLKNWTEGGLEEIEATRNLSYHTPDRVSEAYKCYVKSVTAVIGCVVKSFT